MTIPLPSLNLSFEKTSTTTTRLDNKNDLSNKNTINLNIINPSESFVSPPITPRPLSRRNSVSSRLSASPGPSSKSSPRPKTRSFNKSPERLKRPSQVLKDYDADEDIETEFEPPEPYNSPAFEDVETDFKNQIISHMMELLLNDVDLLKNISERGNKVIFHVEQLKQLIAILYLSKSDREKYNELIDIETEEVIINNRFCKNCSSPFYLKTKSITVNKSVNFLNTPFAVNMSSVFKISLEHVIRETKI
jgi:hypothetical protein